MSHIVRAPSPSIYHIIPPTRTLQKLQGAFDAEKKPTESGGSWPQLRTTFDLLCFSNSVRRSDAAALSFYYNRPAAVRAGLPSDSIRSGFLSWRLLSIILQKLNPFYSKNAPPLMHFKWNSKHPVV